VILRLFLLFTLVPLLELFLLLRIGEAVGLLPTLALVLGTGALGAWLAKSQGTQVLARIRSETNAGRVPAQALVDGALVLVAGAVLLTPGLLTDLAGFLLLIPGSRARLRSWLIEYFRRRAEKKKADPGVIIIEP
jgi:UPF0716 protein FxsA